MSFVWRRAGHVAATPMLEQRRLLSFGNRVLGLTIFRPWSSGSNSPMIAGLFERARHRHAESYLTERASIQTSILNFVQGYSKVYRASATSFKRYEFMRPSA
jgi:hypothetical protein